MPDYDSECSRCYRCEACNTNISCNLARNRACSECGYCSNCCHCSRCTRCGLAYTGNTCTSCNTCLNCCRCRNCLSCNHRFSATCITCGNCINHCECTGVFRCEAGAPFYAPKFQDRKLFDCTRTVGVEWEFNNILTARPLLKWQLEWRGGVHRDGSCGEEAVTPPLAGDNILKCLEGLGKAFHDGSAKSDLRCGIHVHVDASDMGWHDIFKLIRVYSKLEPLLYLLAGQNRLENQYCEPCGPKLLRNLDAKDPKGAILTDCYSSINGRAYKKECNGKTDKKSGLRYRGLNLQPWLAGRFSKGNKPDTTIEFRLHRNTLDPYRVIGWAKVCARLIDWTDKASDADIATLPPSAARALAEVIAPDCAPWIIGRIMAWHKVTKRRNRKVMFKAGNYCTIDSL